MAYGQNGPSCDPLQEKLFTSYWVIGLKVHGLIFV